MEGCEYETFADVVARLHFFIEQVYDYKRLHSALGYHSSNDFEKALLSQEKEVPRQTFLTPPDQS